MPPVLEFERISKEYRSFWGRRSVRALNDFSLSVEAGEIFGFLGPNGAGKTTAIHLAMGFMRPTTGHGRMLGQAFGHTETRRRVGFLGENVALYHRPADRLLCFYGVLNGMRDPELARRVSAVLEEVDLSSESGRNVGKFSRGMQQRMGLAQALVSDPELLMLDEPTSALDPLARVAVRELLQRARDAGKTVFLSSHQLSEVELICDRVAIIHRGHIARLGTISGLLESETRFEVAARGVEAAAITGAKASNGLLTFQVQASSQRAAIEQVWSRGGEIVSVNPVRKTLEDIFIEVTKEEN
ncbi:MAG: ATP-binding cassette domain-containing protein [Terriglobales bacterium]